MGVSRARVEAGHAARLPQVVFARAAPRGPVGRLVCVCEWVYLDAHIVVSAEDGLVQSALSLRSIIQLQQTVRPLEAAYDRYASRSNLRLGVNKLLQAVSEETVCVTALPAGGVYPTPANSSTTSLD